MLSKKRKPLELGLLVVMLAFFVQAASLLAQQGDSPGQPSETSDPWALLKLLEGTWEGDIDGKLGKGKGVRRYEFILGDKFLLSRHRSVRLPQEKSPEGDQHEELTVFSYDSVRKTIVLREFMIEGVVVRSPCQVEGKKMICTSEAVESGPGIRARLTLEITDGYRFTELYELGWPGRELEHYFTIRWTRSPLPVHWD